MMRRLSWHVGTTVFSAIAVTLIALVGLNSVGAIIDESNDVMPEWVMQEWEPCDLEGAGIVFSPELLRVVITKMSKGKTCAEDRLVLEMLIDLDEETLEFISAAFFQRLRNSPCSRNDPCWSHNLVQLIRKKARATSVVDYRPIAVVSVLYKVYSACLLLFVGGVKTNSGPHSLPFGRITRPPRWFLYLGA